MYKAGPRILALNYEDLTWSSVYLWGVNTIMTSEGASLENYWAHIFHFKFKIDTICTNTPCQYVSNLHVNVTTALPQYFYPPRRKATFLPKPSEMFKRSNNAHRGALLEMSFEALQKISPMGAYDEF